MKDPKFGKNKIQSFIEFDSSHGRVRLGEENDKLFVEINETKHYLTNSSGEVIATLGEVIAGNGITIDGVTLKDGGILKTPTVEEHTDIVTLTATQIVGTAAGDVGHVDGAILVAAPAAGYVLEFVSAMFIYDYATAAYTGGADDIVVQVGASGTQVTVSGAITGAELLEAAADKLLQLNAIATELAPAAGSAISIAGTALTQPGTAAGVLRVHVTYKVHATGL